GSSPSNDNAAQLAVEAGAMSSAVRNAQYRRHYLSPFNDTGDGDYLCKNFSPDEAAASTQGALVPTGVAPGSPSGAGGSKGRGNDGTSGAMVEVGRSFICGRSGYVYVTPRKPLREDTKFSLGTFAQVVSTAFFVDRLLASAP
ncbi:unnamed protein product, partial [Amoebophrya sp. A25]